MRDVAVVSFAQSTHVRRLPGLNEVEMLMPVLGEVRDKTVPKMTMVSPPTGGGCISTRTFIPHRCHATIGVFGAISVATACLLPDSPAASVAAIPDGASKKLSVEHPTGALDVLINLDEGSDYPEIKRAAFLRTARKLFEGNVFCRD